MMPTTGSMFTTEELTMFREGLLGRRILTEIHGCFRLPVTEGWKRGLQINADQHLLVVRDGHGIYRFEDGEVPLAKGSLLLVTDGCPHRAVLPEGQAMLITGLRFGIRDARTGAGVPFPPRPGWFSRRDIHPEETDALCARMAWHLDSAISPLHQFAAESILTAILAGFLSEAHPTVSSVPDSRAQTVRQWIDQDLAAHTSIHDLAGRLGVSGRQLLACFTETYGMSVQAYRLKVRMHHACWLLTTTDLSVGDIAGSLGYSDAFAFSRQFRRYTGSAPVHFRKKARNEEN